MRNSDTTAETVEPNQRTRRVENGLRRAGLPLLLLFGTAAFLAASASAAPTVAIVTPSEGASVDSGTVALTLDIQNLTLNGAAVGQAAVTGEGHYHLLLDGAYVKFDYTTATFLADVAEGTHEVRVELAENDHTLLGINATVNVTVLSGAPRLRIVSPSSSGAWGSSSAEIQVWKENFTYNPSAVGQTSVAGEGHYHVVVNGVYFYFGTTEFFNVTYLKIGGANTVRVELANNDHTFLSDPAFDEVRLTVPSGVPEIKLDAALFEAQVDSSSLEAALTFSNITIDAAAIGQTSVPGRGHYHSWLDGVLLGPSAANPLILTDLPEGPHMLVVELRNNDHSVLSPRLVDWEPFTVLAGAPRVSILSPASSSAWGSSSAEIQVSKANFAYNPAAVGQASVAGEGHYHVFVDGVYFYYGTTEFFNVTYLHIGRANTIRVELANNDHTSLSDPVFDEVRLTVPSGVPEIKLDAALFEAQVNAASLEAGLTFSNITIDGAAIGQPSVAGRGHYHAWLDGILLGPSAASAVLLTELSAGPHLLVVELRNNDHSPLVPRVVDWEPFTVLAGAPGISITSPAAATAIGLNFTVVTVATQNFSIVDKGGLPNVAGEGHWHLVLDGALYNMFYGPSGVVLALAGGTHTIRAELAQNDHTPLASPAFDIVTVTVGGLMPTLSIASPAAGAVLYGNSTDVTVAIANFTLAPSKVGQAAVNGEGHWHVFVDGVYSGNTATLSFTLAGLAPGDHVVMAQLFNNDHTPLAVEVSASVSITVAAVPSVRVTTPAAELTTTTGQVTVTVELGNFTLDPVGTPTNAAGHGHLHVFVDGNLTEMVSVRTINVSNLSVGTHTIRIELANNDHSAIAGAGSASTVTATVNAPPPPPARGFLPGFGAAEGLAALAALAVMVGALRRRRA